MLVQRKKMSHEKWVFVRMSLVRGVLIGWGVCVRGGWGRV